jgi:hypothetical protein
MDSRRGYCAPEADLIRPKRRGFANLLTLAFLFAQLGMAVHANTHLKLDPHSAPVQTCGECQTFAPLQSMAGGGTIDVLTVVVQHDHVGPADSNSLAPQRAFTAFRSRAPPVSF